MGTPNEGINGTLGAGLLAHWCFDGDENTSLIDSSVNNRNLTKNGTPTLSPDKDEINQCYRLTTTGQYFNVANLGIELKNSISVWFKLDSYNSGSSFIICCGSWSNNGLRAIVVTSGGKLRFDTHNAGLTTSQYVSLSVWHNVVVVWDSSHGNKIFFDKKLVASPVLSMYLAGTYGDFLIGNFYNFSASNQLLGYVDEIRYYNRLLTYGNVGIGETATEEIAEIYDMGVNYTTLPVETPVISPSTGTYNYEADITIACSTPSSTIYYTTNGSTPTNASTVYTGTFKLTQSSTIKAIAYADGVTTSEIASSTFTILNPNIPPIVPEYKSNIDSKTKNDIYIEPLFEQRMNFQNSLNRTGYFIKDINGNDIKDTISGGRQIYKCLNLTNMGGILLYTSKNWSLITGSFDMETKTGLSNYYNAFTIPDDEYVYYKTGARIEKVTSFDGDFLTLSFPFDTKTFSIFKVILNGKETTSYTIIDDTNDNIINFTSGCNTFGNNLIIVYYLIQQTYINQTCDLYFKSPIKIIPTVSVLKNGKKLIGKVRRHSTTSNQIVGTNTLFLSELKIGYMLNVGGYNFKVMSIIDNFNITVDRVLPPFSYQDMYLFLALNMMAVDTDFNLAHTSTSYQRNIYQSKLGTRKFLSTAKTTQLTKWIDKYGSIYENYYFPVMTNSVSNYISKGDTFRIILVNKMTNDLTILTNARLSEKTSQTVGIDKNTETLNIEYTDKINITSIDGVQVVRKDNV